MPTIWIEQFYNRWVKILFYLVSFEKKKKKKKNKCKADRMILLLYKNLFQIGAIRNQREVCYYDRIIVIWF